LNINYLKKLKGGQHMNEVKLSHRLSTVAKYIPKGSFMADIGSDHAYLPSYAILNNIALRAVAGEVVKGPFLSAKTQVEKLNLQSKITVRLANGLFAIEDEAIDCITICGMGGPLIAEILEKGKNKLNSVHRLILQPNVGSHVVRKWLFENGWKIEMEEIIEEDTKIYEIIVADKGLDLENYKTNFNKKIFFGPYLMLERNSAFKKKWDNELNSLYLALESMKKAKQSNEVIEKGNELTERIKQIEEVLSE
jgi:tRNA (adenine22-N1)-methyltransferase